MGAEGADAGREEEEGKAERSLPSTRWALVAERSRASHLEGNAPEAGPHADGSAFKAARVSNIAIAFIAAQKSGARHGTRRLAGTLKPKVQVQEVDDVYAERSLLCLTKANPFRRWAIRAVSHRYYEGFTLVLITASCTTLAMDSTREGFQETSQGKSLQILEYLWASLMCAEILVRIVARGLVIPKSAFLRSGWGHLDVMVLALGFLNLVPGANNYSAIRAFRVLRPLRAVSRLRNLKVLVVTLLTSLPMLAHVVILCALIYFAFGVVGVEVFAGVLQYSCALPDFSGAYQVVSGGLAVLGNVTYPLTDAQNEGTCMGPKLRDPGWRVVAGDAPATSSFEPNVYDTRGGFQCADGMFCVRGANPSYGYTSFDNILWAWLTIFMCITQESWTDVMYNVQDAVSYWVWPYFVGMLVFGSFFLMNLALVVLYVQFTKSEAAVRNQVLAAEPPMRRSDSSLDDRAHGESYEDAGSEEGEGFRKPQPQHEEPVELPSFGSVPPSPGHPPTWRRRARHALHDLARSNGLYVTTIAAIFINTAVMCVNWYGMSTRLDNALSMVNAVLTVYFVAELLIKIIGIGPRRFFRDKFNNFETAVVVASIIEVITDLVPSIGGVGPLSVLRTLRFLRLLRLVTRWVELRRVIHTLFKSVLSVAWMSLLTLLFLIIAALLGMQIFGYRFQFCDYVSGAAASCPLGQRVWGDCPDHFYCYLPCEAAAVGSWLTVPGSQFFGQAYCQAFCEDGSFTGDGAAAGGAAAALLAAAAAGNASAAAVGSVRCEAVAAVGKSAVSLSTFDNFGWSLLTVFQLITGENWNNVMYDGMRSVGAVSALYFVSVIVVGNYVVLNLFIAILLENFAANMGDLGDTNNGLVAADQDPDCEDLGAQTRTESFLRAEEDADRQWYRAIFTQPPHQVHPDTAKAPGGGGPPGGGPGGGGGGGGGGAPGRSVVAGGIAWGAEPSKHGGKVYHVHRGLMAGAGAGDGGGEGGGGGGGDGGGGKGELEAKAGVGAAAPDGYWDAGKWVERSAHSYFQAQLAKPQADAPPMNLENLMVGKSLWLFSPRSGFRLRCMRLVTWKYFDYVILTFILLSSIMLAVDSPGLERDRPDIALILRYLDVVWSSVFITEAVLKITAAGFLLNGPGSYLREGWNVLDFIIVIASIALIVIQFGVAQGQSNVSMLRALRTLRVLRPLRIASTSEQLKVVINALFSSLRSLVYVGLVCLLFYLLFGILGVNLLKGELRYCAGPSGLPLDAWALLPPGATIDRAWCAAGYHMVTTNSYLAPLNLTLPVPGNQSTRWVHPTLNFDNVGVSMLTLFGVATTELWVDIMSQAIAAVGPEQQPVRDANPVMSLYFVAFLIVGSFLVLNLLVAITIEKFGELQSRHLGYNLFLTLQQQAWVDVQRVMTDTRPERLLVPPGAKASKLRWLVYDLIASYRFQMVMYGVVAVSIIFMALNHSDESGTWKDISFWSDVVCSAFFVVEALLQIYGMGWKQYFTDSWYFMLAIIAVASTASVILGGMGINATVLAPLLRVLRVTRFLRIVTAVEGLQHLVRTLWLALPAILNVGSVMLLFFFIWSVLGMNLFAGIKYGTYLNRHNNFNSWASSMMVLFRSLTGESWDGIMADCMISSNCVELLANATSAATGLPMLAGSFYSPHAADIRGLPDALLDNRCSPAAAVAVLYFIFFELLCAYIILNIVVAIMLEGMISDEADELLPVPRSAMGQFVAVWSELDPGGTSYIRAGELPILIMELDPPLGNRGTACMRAGAQDIIMTSDIPNRRNRFHFLEVLHALAGRVAGAELPDMTEDKVFGRLEKRLPRDAPHPVYTAAHYHAAMHVAAAVKGFLVRYEIREQLADFYQQLAAMEAEEAARLQHGVAAFVGAKAAGSGGGGGSKGGSKGGSRGGSRGGSKGSSRGPSRGGSTGGGAAGPAAAALWGKGGGGGALGGPQQQQQPPPLGTCRGPSDSAASREAAAAQDPLLGFADGLPPCSPSAALDDHFTDDTARDRGGGGGGGGGGSRHGPPPATPPSDRRDPSAHAHPRPSPHPRPPPYPHPLSPAPSPVSPLALGPGGRAHRTSAMGLSPPGAGMAGEQGGGGRPGSAAAWGTRADGSGGGAPGGVGAGLGAALSALGQEMEAMMQRPGNTMLRNRMQGGGGEGRSPSPVPQLMLSAPARGAPGPGPAGGVRQERAPEAAAGEGEGGGGGGGGGLGSGPADWAVQSLLSVHDMDLDAGMAELEAELEAGPSATAGSGRSLGPGGGGGGAAPQGGPPPDAGRASSAQPPARQPSGAAEGGRGSRGGSRGGGGTEGGGGAAGTWAAGSMERVASVKADASLLGGLDGVQGVGEAAGAEEGGRGREGELSRPQTVDEVGGARGGGGGGR